MATTSTSRSSNRTSLDVEYSAPTRAATEAATSALMSLTCVTSKSCLNRAKAVEYASLPKPRNTPVQDMDKVPALVKTGDPIRNIAPCAACHGGIERKLGTPWLEGMPREYLAQQLGAFASGERRNDSHKQMRNVARGMTPAEISEVADFYARQAHE